MDVTMLYQAYITKSTLMGLAFLFCHQHPALPVIISKSEVVIVELIINGEPRTVKDVSSITDLLVQFKLEQKILVIELNREIIERTDYEKTLLHEGDRIEIVHFVGGG